MKKSWEKWKVLVDTEINKKLESYRNISNPNETRNQEILKNITTVMKGEMSKTTSW